MPDYEKMSMSELEAARVELGGKMFELAQEQGKIATIINERNAKDAIAQTFAGMSEPERKEMAQLIMGAGGIKSKEEMGKL